MMKKTIAFVCCILLALGIVALSACQRPDSNPAADDPKASQGLTYELNESRTAYIVTGMGSCTDTRLVIPSTYKGLPVAEIADGAFQAVTPPSKPTVSDNDEKDKEKEKAELEKEGKLLAKVGVSLLSVIQLVDETIEAAAPTEQAKPEAEITEVVIPDSVMQIGNEAFYGCTSLVSFETSNLINLIGTDAFKNTAYYLDESNWTDGRLYLEEYLVEVRPEVTGDFVVREGTVNIASSAFLNCTGITSVSFPETLRFVGDMAFMGCTSITEIDLSMPGIQIGSQAFENCTALTSVCIATNDQPNAPPSQSFIGVGVLGSDEVFMPGGSMDFAFDPTADPELIYSAYIAGGAFRGCTSLVSVTLGSNIGDLGNEVFRGCTSLVSIDMSAITAAHPEVAVVTPSTNRRWHTTLERLFWDCTSLKEVKLPQGIQYLKGTFMGCTALESFTVPGTVKGLNQTFVSCSALKSVTLPEGLEALSNTFANCTSLEQLTLPSSLVKIGDDTFLRCHALQSIDIPDSVTELGESAFGGCQSLIYLFIPDSVTAIKRNTFSYLSEHIDISLGSAITSIDRFAFDLVYSLTFRGTMAQWQAIARHEDWASSDTSDGPLIICIDGTLAGDEVFPVHATPMTGIVLEDGTAYVSFLGVTVKSFDDGRDQIVPLTLEEIEAELLTSGTDGWRYVTDTEIRQLDNYIYNRAFHVAKYFHGGTGK